MPDSDIFSEWLIDQQIAFCANIVASQSPGADLSFRIRRAIAGHFIQTQLSPLDDEHTSKRLWLLSPSTLALLNYIDPYALKPSEDEGYDLLAIRAKAEQAQRRLLEDEAGLELVNYAVQLLVGDIELRAPGQAWAIGRGGKEAALKLCKGTQWVRTPPGKG